MKTDRIVITTNGGYPLDRDLYQTVKALIGAAFRDAVYKNSSNFLFFLLIV